MSNPFTYFARPTCAREFQSNANHATYERMAAQDEVNENDKLAASMRKPPLGFGAAAALDLHTARWVEKELIRRARSVRLAENADRPGA